MGVDLFGRTLRSFATSLPYLSASSFRTLQSLVTSSPTSPTTSTISPPSSISSSSLPPHLPSTLTSTAPSSIFHLYTLEGRLLHEQSNTMTMLTRSGGGVLPSIEDGLPVAKRTRTLKAATATVTNARKPPRNELNAPATPSNFPRQVQRKMGTIQRRPVAPRPAATPSAARSVSRPRPRHVYRPQQEAVTITKAVVDQQYSIEIVKIALTATVCIPLLHLYRFNAICP